MDGFVELAALARARKAARFAEVHKRETEDVLEQATAPLKERIVELEDLLANSEATRDRLAKELENSEAQYKALEAQYKALEAQYKALEAQYKALEARAAEVSASAPAKKKGK